MKRLSLLIVLVLGVTTLYAQDFLNKSKVSGSFEINAQYYMADDGIGITDSTLNGKLHRKQGSVCLLIAQLCLTLCNRL